MKEAFLTVKCLRKDGMFDIWPAQTVSFWPADEVTEKRNLVRFEMLNGVAGSFDRGTVYVMNSGGKTIETIFLDDFRDLAAE